MKFTRTVNYNVVKSKTVLKAENGLKYLQIIRDNYFLINFTLSDCVLFPDSSMK